MVGRALNEEICRTVRARRAELPARHLLLNGKDSSETLKSPYLRSRENGVWPLEPRRPARLICRAPRF